MLPKWRRLRSQIRSQLIEWAGKRVPLRMWLIIVSIPVSISGAIFGLWSWIIATFVASLACVVSMVSEHGSILAQTKEISEAIHEYGTIMSTEHQFGDFLIVYEVGQNRLLYRDRWFRSFEMCPAGQHPIAIMHLFYVGASSENVILNYRKLRIKSWCDNATLDTNGNEPAETTEEDRRECNRVLVVPSKTTQEPNTRISMQLLFYKAINPGERRRVHATGITPGTWNDLRSRGQDTGKFRLHKPAEELEICIVFPPAWDNTEISFTRVSAPGMTDDNQIGTIKWGTSNTGKRCVSWIIPQAPEGTYEYFVKLAT